MSLLRSALFYLAEALAWRRLDKRVLAHLQQRVSPTAISPCYWDLWRLYRAVRRRRPRVVWEFGAGWSTWFLAQGLADNGSGRLYSMDADQSWANHAQSLRPPWLKAEIRFAPVTLVDVRGERGWRHSNRPEDTMPDLIYLDGPSGMEECKGCADIPDIENRLEPGCLVIIDGRSGTTAMLRRTLRRRWNSWEEHSPLVSKSVVRMFELVS